jgi:1-acyl-sn-glycerol-3-phosphate acyltransferase
MALVDRWFNRTPRGMSLDAARGAAIVPPAGWEPPPRDRLRDVARTLRVVGGVLAGIVADGRRDPTGAVRDSTTAEGLALIQQDLAARVRQLGLTITVHHADRVPRTGGLIFMWNQTSHLDHVVLPIAIPRPFHTTYNNEVRRFPIYGARIRRTDHFWIDRTDENQWREQLARAAERVRAGACILISPEGTRSWDGRLLPMKRGAFLLARLAAQPIVCVTIRGARACLPRGRLGVRPGAIDVELSEPIRVDATTEPILESVVASTFEASIVRGGGRD